MKVADRSAIRTLIRGASHDDHSRRSRFDITLLGLLVLTLSLVGCNGAPPTETPKQGVIGVSLLADDDPFFVNMSEAMKEHGNTAGYDVIIAWGNSNSARQEQQVDDFIKQGVDAIILCPVNDSIATSIRKTNAAGIPVFTADIAVLVEGAEVVSHVATDNYRGGQLAADAMFESLGGSGRVAIINHPTVDSVILRARGFVQRMAELRQSKGGDIEVVTESGRGSRVRWFRTPQQILQEQPEIDGVFAVTDSLALEVVAELDKSNKLDDVVVVGFDGQPAALQALEAGKITADVIQHPKLIARMVTNAIVNYRAGKDVPAEQLISPTIQRSR